MPDQGVDGVARRTGNLAHDRATLAGQRVEQHGLADVGPSDDGKPDVRVGFRKLRLRWEVLNDLGHHVVEAQVVVAADRMRIAQAKLMELIGPSRLGIRIDLLTPRTTGLPLSRRRSLTSMSEAVTPWVTSTAMTMISASSIAISNCARTWRHRSVSGNISSPPYRRG